MNRRTLVLGCLGAAALFTSGCTVPIALTAEECSVPPEPIELGVRADAAVPLHLELVLTAPEATAVDVLTSKFVLFWLPRAHVFRPRPAFERMARDFIAQVFLHAGRPLDGNLGLQVKSIKIGTEEVTVALDVAVRLASGAELLKKTFTQSSALDQSPNKSTTYVLPKFKDSKFERRDYHGDRIYQDAGAAIARAFAACLRECASDLTTPGFLARARDPQLLAEAMLRRGAEPSEAQVETKPPPAAVPAASPSVPKHPPGFAQIEASRAEPAERERRVAVLVCSNVYTNHPNWNVSWIVGNTDRLQEALRRHAGFDEVLVVSGEDSERATVENLFANRLPGLLDGRRNVLLFYYTGHGYVDGQRRPLFLTKNTLLRDGELSNVYGYADVGGWLGALKARLVASGRELETLLLVDACRPAVLAPPGHATVEAIADHEVQSCAEDRLSEADPSRSESLFTRDVSKGAQTPVLRAGGGRFRLVEQVVEDLEVVMTDVDSGAPITDGVLVMGDSRLERAPYRLPLVRTGDVTLAVEHPSYGKLTRTLRLEPDTRRLSVALSAMSAEEQVFSRAKEQDEARSYSQYLERYPRGRFAKAAEERFREKIVEGPVEGRVVFPAGDYHFDTDLVVAPTGTLVAQPGARFLFQPKRRLLVRGRLEVNGTRERPVAFLPQRGEWWGIELERALGAWLEHALVTGSSGSGVEVVGCDALLVNCTLRGNSGEVGGGLRVDRGLVRVVNGSFLSNQAKNGWAIHAHESRVVLENCLISANASPSDSWRKEGGAVVVVGGSLEARRTSFHGNERALLVEGADGLVQDCVFTLNRGGTSAALLRATGLRLQRCLLDKNGEGQTAVLRVEGGAPQILGNSFEAGQVYADALVLTGGTRALVEGNLLRGFRRGVVAAWAAPRVARNVVLACGQGLVCEEDSAAQLEANVVQDNDLGVLVAAADSRCKAPAPVVRGNLIQGNGQGVRVSNAIPSIERNMIRKNGRGAAYGGGLQVLRGDGTFTRATVRHNVIADNEVKSVTHDGKTYRGLGGGVFLEEGVTAQVLGNLVQGNRSDHECGGIASNSQAVEVVGNCVIDNTAPSRGNGFTGKGSVNDPARLSAPVGLPEDSPPGLGGGAPGLSCDVALVGVRGDVVLSVGDEFEQLRAQSAARRAEEAARQAQAAAEAEAKGIYEGSLDRLSVGASVLVRVTGRTDGSVWGTTIYSLDSNLGTAAVHAGLVRPGETAVVLLTRLGPQGAFSGTRRNGVQTSSYGAFHGSYRLDPRRSEVR